MVVVFNLFLRYFKFLVRVRQQVGKDLLTWNQLQEGINSVNNSVQDEHERMEHTHTHTHTEVVSSDECPRSVVEQNILWVCITDQ